MTKPKYVFLVTRNHYHDYIFFDDDRALESVEIIKTFTTSKKAYDYYKKNMSRTPYLQITRLEVE